MPAKRAASRARSASGRRRGGVYRNAASPAGTVGGVLPRAPLARQNSGVRAGVVMDAVGGRVQRRPACGASTRAPRAAGHAHPPKLAGVCVTGQRSRRAAPSSAQRARRPAAAPLSARFVRRLRRDRHPAGRSRLRAADSGGADSSRRSCVAQRRRDVTAWRLDAAIIGARF